MRADISIKAQHQAEAHWLHNRAFCNPYDRDTLKWLAYEFTALQILRRERAKNALPKNQRKIVDLCEAAKRVGMAIKYIRYGARQADVQTNSGNNARRSVAGLSEKPKQNAKPLF